MLIRFIGLTGFLRLIGFIGLIGFLGLIGFRVGLDESPILFRGLFEARYTIMIPGMWDHNLGNLNSRL